MQQTYGIITVMAVVDIFVILLTLALVLILPSLVVIVLLLSAKDKFAQLDAVKQKVVVTKRGEKLIIEDWKE